MSECIDEPIDILLVEDNPGDVRLTQIAFRSQGVDVDLSVATDGDEALEALERRRRADSTLPDLILLDLNLPRMSGFEFLEAIQDVRALARIPILVLTSSTTSEDVLESYRRDANAYLTKPTDPDEYAAMVDAVTDFWFRRVAFPPTPS